MNIELNKNGDVVVVSIEGRLIVSSAKTFKESFSEITEISNFVVLELSEMEYIDSMGLGSVISLYKVLKENDGDMCITNLQSKPQTLFQITKVNLIFDIFEELDEAVKNMQQKCDNRVN
jgi:anti-sigma B factor antagonist